ncbi:ATP-binding protein [Brevifollis gellanilyticus]|uniref:histidine kinase n=1 Tax=Brevifollis gellanilyticus TaxID=748831 RepID=A0A512MD50_9BACT|nr:ATP-binding protein [Brevifollis gellanilyticus]GEP44663.1 two-component hybrid sensor and regulator [Brevifollis gellanilyticus]
MTSEPATTQSADATFDAGVFFGGGEMGARTRALDWDATPMGPVEQWPAALKSTLGICLNSRFPMAVYWGEEGFLFYNDAWRPILGDKHPWALGCGAREVWPEIWQDIAPLFASVRTTREGTWRGDALLPMHRSGYTEECYFDYTFNPIMGATGVVEGILNVVQETTHRVLNDRRTRLLHALATATADAKTANQVCERAARTLQDFVHDVPFALIYLTAGKGANLAAAAGVLPESEMAPEFISLGEDQTDEMCWPLFKAMEDKLHVHLKDGAALPGGPWPEPTHTAIVVPLKKGAFEEPFGFLVAGTSPRRSLDESYESFFDLLAGSIASSIGNARAFEQEKTRAEALAELDRAKTAFFSNVSHELRTPLTLMLGPIEEELRDDPENERLELAHRNSVRLLRLVNTLLDFSRIEAGRIQAVYEPVDLAALTTELASGFRSAIEGAGLQLVVQCPPLPQLVHVDVEMWEKIVLNLLSNAFKFTFEGEIIIALRWRGDAVELVVTDTGSGIPAAELPHIFERFHRVRGTRSRTHEGTGIGLALVEELARLHGGSVSVVSQEGRGSVFTVTIRAGTAHLPADRLGAPRTLDSTATRVGSFVAEARRWHDGGGLADEADREAKDIRPAKADASQPTRILLADDNADMREYVTRLLAPHYDVTVVADGQAALEAARSQPPDLVLTDVMMPRLDGFGLLRELRADPALSTLPVILLSARAGEESRVEGMAEGADDYLVKPFSARELIARVEAHLKLARVRSRAEKAMRESEERYRGIVNQTVAGIAELDLAGRFLMVNDQYCETTGYSREELMEKGMEGITHPQDVPAYQKLLIALVEEDVPFEMEMSHVRKDGSVVWVHSSVSVIRDASGKALSVIAITIDITARRLAEDQLRESAQLLRSVNDSTSELIYMKDLGGKLTYANLATLHVLGMNEDDALRVSEPERYLDKAEVDEIMANDRRAAEGSEAISVEEVLTCADGQRRVYLSTKTPLRDASGKVIGIIGVSRDNTERKRAAEALAKAKEVAEAASRAKDDFLAALSHELRNPLNPVLLASGEMSKDTSLSAETREQLVMIHRNIQLEARLIDDLLDLTRIGRGLLRLDTAPTDAHVLLLHVEEIVRPDATLAHVELKLSLEAEEHHLLGDAARLQQVFWNLMKNAIKFSAGAGRVCVRTFNPAPGRLAITVSDMGIGIAKEALGRIFLPFEQGEVGAQHRFGGLGLGLAISKAVVDLHGGELGAESAGPGQGAIFTVELATADTTMMEAEPPAQHGPMESAPVESLTLLVVEDHEATLNILKRLLQHDGHCVRAAGNVADALALAAEHECDLVVSDLGLPDGSGLDLMRALRERHGWRGIALSGYGTDDDVRQAREAGFAAHLLKPVDMDDLRRAIREVREGATGRFTGSTAY